MRPWRGAWYEIESTVDSPPMCSSRPIFPFLLIFAIGCGVKVGMSITSIDSAWDHVTWTFVPNFLCDTPECVSLPANQKDPAGAIDGNLATRWTSGRSQGSGGMAETGTVTFPT